MSGKPNPVCHVFKDPAINPQLLEGLTSRLTASFSSIGLEVPTKLHNHSPPQSSFDAFRRQYKGSEVVSDVVDYARKIPQTSITGRMNLVLYLLAGDAYAPSLNFIFGVAHSDEGCLVALHRLENDKGFIFKECVHELGHVFGLDHCRLPCVMTFSNSVHEAHQKSTEFCTKHQAQLKQYIPP